MAERLQWAAPLLHITLEQLLFRKCSNELEGKLGSEMATSAKSTISQVAQVQNTLCRELQKGTSEVQQWMTQCPVKFISDV